MIRRQVVRCVSQTAKCVMSRNITSAVRTANTCELLHKVPLVRISGPVGAFHRSHQLRNEHIMNIQDEDDFKTRVTESSKPIIVDFHATWCGPCKLLGPKLEAVVAKGNGDVLMAKVDIDDNTNLAIEYGVEAVPTVIGMKNGKVVDKFVGVKMGEELDAFVRKLTGK